VTNARPKALVGISALGFNELIQNGFQHLSPVLEPVTVQLIQSPVNFFVVRNSTIQSDAWKPTPAYTPEVEIFLHDSHENNSCGHTIITGRCGEVRHNPTPDLWINQVFVNFRFELGNQGFI